MKNKQITTFGGGCFWCIEAVIQRLEGVESLVSGYAGGDTSPQIIEPFLQALQVTPR